MQIKDLMTKNVVTVDKEDTLDQVARVMNEKNVGAVPVLSGKDLCGMVTDRDLVVRCLAQGKDAQSVMVSEIMTPTTACLTADQTVEDAVNMMKAEKVRRIPVLNNGKVDGIITLGDIAQSRMEAEAADCLADICRPKQP